MWGLASPAAAVLPALRPRLPQRYGRARPGIPSREDGSTHRCPRGTWPHISRSARALLSRRMRTRIGARRAPRDEANSLCGLYVADRVLGPMAAAEQISMAADNGVTTLSSRRQGPRCGQPDEQVSSCLHWPSIIQQRPAASGGTRSTDALYPGESGPHRRLRGAPSSDFHSVGCLTLTSTFDRRPRRAACCGRRVVADVGTTPAAS
jgi:hypothetical protein